MLSNAYFLEKIRFDTAENEPAKNLQKICKFHFKFAKHFQNILRILAVFAPARIRISTVSLEMRTSRRRQKKGGRRVHRVDVLLALGCRPRAVASVLPKLPSNLEHIANGDLAGLKLRKADAVEVLVIPKQRF